MIKGIDVSKHNGTIDFKKVKDSGIKFVIIRAGYGGSAPVKDEKFEENYKNARANGLLVGAYIYSYADTPSDITCEKEAVIKWLDGRHLDLPVFLDLEDAKTSKCNKVEITSFANEFCTYIKNKGYKAGIYANKYWLLNKIDIDNLLANVDVTIWLAEWNNNPTYKGRYSIWQYTSKGHVNGINGNVDMNYLYDDNIINNENNESSEYKGNSIVDYLKSIGVESSYKNRKKLAKENGIKNYSGTAEQNLKLLEILRGKKTSNYKGNSIVDYLKSVGIDSSYKNRKKLAKENGINNYTGTANQNLKLLEKLRGF